MAYRVLVVKRLDPNRGRQTDSPRLRWGETAWRLLLVLLLSPLFRIEAFAAPAITIMGLPAYGTTGVMRGIVTGADPSQYRVSSFLFVAGLGWYRKPFDAAPTVPIASDGTWSADVNTSGSAGLDSVATIFGAWLVPNGYVVPPSPPGNYRVPIELDAFAHDIKERYGPTIQFGNRTWAVKDASLPVGPDAGSRANYFSKLASDIWVDAAGLHLTVHQHDGKWWATEATLLGERLGYGTYWYQTASRTDTLDVNVTFGGGFSFDDYGDEASPDGSHHREIEMGEDSRWGSATDPNTQNVKQPFDYRPENRHRFNLPSLAADPALTRIMVWNPDSIRFITLKGHYTPDNYPSAAVVHEYVYQHNPSGGQYVPVPGRERFHFNLWLNKIANASAPTDGQPVEVIVRAFGFVPRAETPSSPNYQGMWWRAPFEPGWGINVTHQADLVFASWFTYGADGTPLWFTMTAQQQDDGSFTGAIDRTSGPPYNAAPFDPTEVMHETVGAGRLAFSNTDTGTFAYTVNGISQVKTLARFVFAGSLPVCTYPGATPPEQATNYQDMWIVPNLVEAGWGINFTHQDDLIFASWFTYDLNGQPWWLTATLAKAGARTYAGALDATTGPPFGSEPFDPTRVLHNTVGSAAVTFSDGANATFVYTLNGVTQSKSKMLTRFVFRPPGTVCEI